MNPLIQRRHEQRLREGRQCDWSKCSRPVDRKTFSKYCKKHKDNIRLNGHPEAKRVYRRELKPYVIACERFITANIDHLGIQSALKWIEDAAMGGRPFLANPGKKAASRQWLEWCARLNVEATPLQVLCTVCAFFAYREDEPRRWPSGIEGDKYFDFQLGLYIARLAPRRIDGGTAITTISPTLLNAISKRLQATLAVLAQRIGIEIHKGIVRGVELHAQYQGKHAYLMGSHLPFGVVVAYLPRARRSRPGQCSPSQIAKTRKTATPSPSKRETYAPAEWRGLSPMALEMINKARLSDDAQQNKGTESNVE